jgi:hypothetical protein
MQASRWRVSAEGRRGEERGTRRNEGGGGKERKGESGGGFLGEEGDATGENGLAFENDARGVDVDEDDSSSWTCLEPCERLAVEAFLPERTEGAVRGSGDWVFWNSEGRGEKAGDEIRGGVGGSGCYDDASERKRF